MALALVGACIVRSTLNDGLFGVLLSAQFSPDEKINRIRSFFESFGPVAPVAYVAVVTVEVVVAPIPGAMLYAPGGVVFGGFWGGLLSLVGNVLGAAISCLLMRGLGHVISDRWANRQSVVGIQQRIADHGVFVVFLLRVNPLTSSDLVSYAAGLTPMPVWKLCLGTAFGMAPLCWVQAYTADHLLTTFPQLLYPLIVLCICYVAIVLAVVWRIVRTGSYGRPEDSPAVVVSLDGET